MKTTVQPTNKDLLKALSYLFGILFIPIIILAGNDLINWVMKLIFKV